MVFISGCSSIRSFFSNENQLNLNKLNNIGNDFYIKNLKSLGDAFIKLNATKIIRLSRSSQAYLNELITLLKKNNELLFGSESIKVYLIEDKRSFYFSYPGGNIVLSNSFIDKFIKHEGFLIAVLAHEMIKSSKGIYNKSYRIPTGQIELEDMIKRAQINLDVRNEVNKWSYFVIKRSGLNPNYYLSWLQTKSKNSFELYMPGNNPQEINSEEFRYKNFLISRKGDDTFTPFMRNSSKGFYGFIEDAKR